MAQNCIQLNDSKYGVILFNYPNSQISVIESTLGPLSFNIKHTARNPGVVFDSDRSLELHFKIVQSCFTYLRAISKIKSFLLHLTGFNRQHHITPILASLHWLPVRFKIDFKILLNTFKAFMGLAPSYIVDVLIQYDPTHSRRSSDGTLLVIPKSRLKSKGDCAFIIRVS